MPRVPFSPRVAPAPLPTPLIRQGLETSGTQQAGEAIARTGDLLAKFAQREQERADFGRMVAVQRQLDDLEHRLLFDPEQGALTQRGRNTIPVHDQTLNVYDQEVARIEQGLPNDRLRQGLRKLALERRGAMGSALERHTASELRQADDDEHKAGIEAAVRRGISYYDQPDQVAASIAEGERLVRSQAQVLGQGPEATADAVASVRSAIHEGVIERALANQRDSYARSYLQEHRGEINAERLVQLEEAVAGQTTLADAFAQRDRIVHEATDLGQALEMVDQIADAEIRKNASSLVKEFYADRRVADQLAEDQLFEQSADRLEQVKSLDVLRREMGEAQWLRLSNQSREQLTLRAERLKGGEQGKESDLRVLTGWYAMSPAEKAKVNPLRDLLPYLTPGDYKSALREWEDARNPAKLAEANGVSSRREQTLAVAQGLGLVSRKAEGKWTENERRSYANLQRSVDAAIEAFRDANKRNPGPTEFQQLLDDITATRLRRKSGWWGSRMVPVTSLTDEDVRKLDEESLQQAMALLSSDDIQKWSYRLGQSGQSPSPRNVLRLFVGQLQHDPAAEEDLLRRDFWGRR